MNLHKKGEDVLNNFVKTVKSARAEIEREVRRVDSSFSFASALPRSQRIVASFENDARITAARDELRAEATGEVSDANSQAYGRGAGDFQREMQRMAASFAQALQQLVLQAHAQDENAARFHGASANRALNQAAGAKNRAADAWRRMSANGFDDNAARSLTNDPMVSPQRLVRRKQLIQELQAAMVYFGVRGRDLCESVLDELVAYVPTALHRILTRA